MPLFSEHFQNSCTSTGELNPFFKFQIQISNLIKMALPHDKQLDKYGTFKEKPLVVPSRKNRYKIGIIFVWSIGILLIISHWLTSSSNPLPTLPSYPTTEIITVYISVTESPRILWGKKDSMNGSAVGVFKDGLLEEGWSQLWIEGIVHNNNTSLASHKVAHYAAGYAEGALTHHRIDQHYHNVHGTFFGKETSAPLAVRQFLDDNLHWIRTQVELHAMGGKFKSSTENKYWETLSLLLSQFDGLVDGYQAHTNATLPLSASDLFLLNADGDLEDLIPAYNKTKTRQPGKSSSFAEAVKSLKCSALIRMTPNASDLLWGHTTWDDYTSMIRIFKHYTLPKLDLNHTVFKTSMSSSPAYLSSVDDFYLLSSGLSVMETTNGIYAEELYGTLTPQCVLSWMRASVANTLSSTSHEWGSTFSKYNSGTYNNQWMIIDTKTFVPGVGFPPYGFLVLEQMPGYVHMADLSKSLNSQGYWASYNVPYFDDIYKGSGFREKYTTSNYSQSWSHDYSSRALIFKRDAPQVYNLQDLKMLMRYNDWQYDPLSFGKPSNAIASRYDLETGLDFKLEGGVDTKVTSLEMASQLECEAISGPTYVDNPVFSWNDYPYHALHIGQPTAFKFPFISMKSHASVEEE